MLKTYPETTMRKLTAFLFAAVLAAFALPALPQGQPQAVQVYAPLTRPLTAITMTAQHAATVNSATQNGYNTSRVVCVFNQASHTGSPSSTFSIQNRDIASGSWYSLITSAAITADTTPTVIAAGAGLPVTSNVSSPLPIASSWRVTLTVAGSATPVVTGTIGCSVQ